MHRFFVSNQNLQGEKVVFLGQQAHQIRNVLRIQPGDRIVVLDNAGWEYEVALTALSRNKITAQVIEKRQAIGEPGVRITLYQSLLKQDKFEWVLQKCTEVGVTQFVPMVTQRSLIQHPGDIKPKKLTRWRRIITEAAEQSGRGRIPELLSPISLEEGLSGLDAFQRCLMACTQAKGRGLRKSLKLGCDTPDTVALLVGPEGGFTDQEVKLGQSSGAVPISLGRRIFRTETAAVVAVSLILYELGELGA
jgi:16S rRNA (uracil1498-N3)-methyltransferase